MLDSLRTYLSRIDQRPVREIDRDIDDELAAHLSAIETDLIESGLSPAEAQKEALSRFGNPQTHKRRCRDVALTERRMKSYAQLILTVAIGLLLAALATSVWFNQQQTAHALDRMATRIDGLNQSLTTRAAPPQPANPSYNNVYITGTPVGRPGAYAMPMDGLSLRRLMAASDVSTKFVKEIAVRHSPKYGEGNTELFSAAQLADLAGPDIDLRNEDLITVTEANR